MTLFALVFSQLRTPIGGHLMCIKGTYLDGHSLLIKRSSHGNDKVGDALEAQRNERELVRQPP